MMTQIDIKKKLLGGFGVMIVITALATGLGWWISKQAAEKTTTIGEETFTDF